MKAEISKYPTTHRGNMGTTFSPTAGRGGRLNKFNDEMQRAGIGAALHTTTSPRNAEYRDLLMNLAKNRPSLPAE